MMDNKGHVSKNTIVLLQANLRSSPAALLSFEFLLEGTPSIAAISDPPKRMRHNPHFKTRDHQWISCNYQEAWTGILIKKGAKRTLICPPTPFVVALATPTPVGLVGIISYYIKPDSVEIALKDLEEAIATMKPITDKFFVLGDSNGHSSLWSQVEENNEIGNKVEELICSHGLIVLNNRNSPPTFFDSRGGGHWIDLSLASPSGSELVNNWKVLENAVAESDHQCLSTELGIQDRPLRPKLVDDWSKVDWEQLRETLLTELANKQLSNLSPLQSTREVNQVVERLTIALQDTAQKCVPKKRLHWNSNGWFDAELRTLLQEYKEARREWRSSKSDDDKARYLQVRSLFRKRSREKKTASFYRFCESLDNDSMWSGLKRISGDKSLVDIEYLTVDDRIVSDDGTLAQTLGNKYFGASGENRSSKMLLKAKEEFRIWRSNLEGKTQAYVELTTEEVEDELKRGRRHSAPGLDGITNRVLKGTAAELAPVVCHIFNECIRLGTFPSAWKDSAVISLRKPGTDPASPRGYRPISLLSSLGKKFESLLNRRLQQHMEETNYWNVNQFGFRTGKSTTKALWRLTQFIYRSFNRRNQTAAISFDIQGAFDNVNPALLWQRLRNSNLPDSILRPITDFLIDRSASVRVRNAEVVFSVNKGVPQGSPLSPSLFLVFIDSILGCMTGTVQGQLFADDLIIFCEVPRQCKKPQDLQKTLTALEDWGKNWLLDFNAEKTKLIRFSRLRKAQKMDLYFKDTRLEENNSIKYLGLTLDAKLRFSDHISHVKNKAARRIQKIRILSSTLYGVAPTVTRTMIMACVIPVLFYGAEIWGHRCSKKTFEAKLNQTLRTAALAITGAFRTSPTVEVLDLAGLHQPNGFATQKLLHFSAKIQPDEMDEFEVDFETHLSSRGKLKLELDRMNKEGISLDARKQNMKLWKEDVKKYVNRIYLKNWDATEPCSGRAELSWGPFWPRNKWFFRKWHRKKVTVLCQFLLNHMKSRSFLHRIGAHPSSKCRLCSNPFEDRSHLFKCDSLESIKAALVGHSTNFENLSDFIKQDTNYNFLGNFLLEVNDTWARET